MRITGSCWPTCGRWPRSAAAISQSWSGASRKRYLSRLFDAEGAEPRPFIEPTTRRPPPSPRWPRPRAPGASGCTTFPRTRTRSGWPPPTGAARAAHDGRAAAAAVLALGSNLGDRRDILQGGVDAIAAIPEVRVTAVSPVYETVPVGGPPQPDYLNAVLLVATSLPPARSARPAARDRGRVRPGPPGPLGAAYARHRHHHRGRRAQRRPGAHAAAPAGARACLRARPVARRRPGGRAPRVRAGGGPAARRRPVGYPPVRGTPGDCRRQGREADAARGRCCSSRRSPPR